MGNILLFICFWGAVLCWAGSSNESSPSLGVFQYDAKSYLMKKTEDLSAVKSSDGFVFFTDTHVKSNDLNTSKFINLVLDKTPIEKVIWGGDAISAYGSKSALDSQWIFQKEAFNLLNPSAKIYCVRGNHDFTIKNAPEDSSGFTYSQAESFKMINEVMESAVVRNDADSTGMYYYFDDSQNKMRYIVLEAFSNSKDGDVAWGVSTGVFKKQLDWIVFTAILTTPPGFNIVFVLHAPITDTTGGAWKNYRNVFDVVSAASEKKSCVVNDAAYDFSSLVKVNVLMVVSGHHHHDMQTYQHGVLHVTTASDAHYNDYIRDPFSVMAGRRKDFAQHCIDVFSFDLKNQLVRVIRIGVGGNRLFHLTPVEIGIKERKTFSISLKGNVKWFSYDAYGNSYKKGKWTLHNNVISVSENGIVIGNTVGDAVLMAQDEFGNREIFNVKVW